MSQRIESKAPAPGCRLIAETLGHPGVGVFVNYKGEQKGGKGDRDALDNLAEICIHGGVISYCRKSGLIAGAAEQKVWLLWRRRYLRR